jgi:hypothetical protein
MESVYWSKSASIDQLPQIVFHQKACDTPLVGVAMERVLFGAPNQVGIFRLIAAAARLLLRFSAGTTMYAPLLENASMT